MERSRDGKRGSVTAGNGLSRRRARSSGLRVSPEDGGVELQETIRLRSRGGKKDRDRDRDRDRSGRSKRRRGDRMMAGSNRDEGEDSSDESVDEEEEDEDDEERTAVLLPPLPSNLSPPSSSLQHNHPPRRGVPPRTAKSPPVWRAADEMIAVSVPRKARSAYAKRSHEHWVSGSSGNGGAGEQLRRQASTSPSRQIHAAAAPAPTSPSSSNASVRKRMKPVGGPKPRPTKVAKSPSSIQEIEIEVAEVLYGLTRQFQDPANKHDSKDTNGCVKDSKCRVLSPSSASAAPGIPKSSLLPPQNSSISTAPLPAVAPKRKRPRPVKFEEEHPTSPSVQSTIPGPLISSIRKASDGDKPKMEHPSPKSEKNSALSLAGNGETSLDLSSHSVGEKTADVEGELVMLDSAHVSDVKSPMPERGCHDAAETKEETPSGDSPREKLKIDLMVPPGNSSSAGETNPPVHEARKLRPVKGSNMEMGEIRGEEKTDESLMELGSRKPPVKERRPLDPPLDIVKQEGETIDAQKQGLRQQSEAPGAGSKPEKTIPHPSLALPMPVAGLPGTLPFGCMSQIPSLQALMPMDGRSSPYKAIQPPHLLPQQLRPKHCSTHCYIAKNIQYHQHIARLGPFWPAAAAAGVASLYGAKPSNPSAAPSPGPAPRSTGSVQDKASPHSSKEKCSSSSSLFADASQRKQLHQQPSPVGTSNSMLHAPAFIFPLNQPHPAAVVAATASRTAPVKPANPNVGSSPVSSSAATCSSSSDVNPSAVSFNYSNLPHGEAQYVVLQNGGYPFPIPAHIGATYRGGSHAQPLPFFNGSFYASQVLHPSQLQPQLPPATTGQQAHQPHTGTSSGSSSQKHPQQHQKNPAGYLSSSGGSTHGFPPSNQRQHQSSHQSVVEEGPSPSESRVSQSQKGIYSSNFSMPVHSQGFAFMSGPTAVVGTAATANHSDKQHHEPPPPQSHQHQHQLQLQQQSMKAAELNSAQAFAMSFAAMNGPNGSRHTGLDLPSKGQHQTIFQSLPPEAASQKKAQYQQSGDGKSMGDPITSGALSAGEDRKTAQAGGKTSSSVSHQSVAFSRTEVDPSSATLCINPVDGSARTLNLISSSAMNGSRASPNQSASSGQNSQQQQQQHLAHLQSQQHQQRQLQFQQQQQQQQQHLQMQQQQRHFQLQQQQQQQQQQLQLQQHLAAARGKPTGASDAAVYSERLPAGTVLRKYSSSAGGGSGGSSGGGYPQPMVQAGIPTQSLQWKSSPRGGPPIASSPSSAPAKNQQLGRAPPQLSFGMNSMKPAHSGPQQQQPAAGSLPSSASSGGASLGSPSTAISKGAGGSSPRASTGGKAAPSTQQPLQSKGAAAPSMLGQRHAAPPPSSAAKSHQEQQQQSQLQKQQSLPPSQLFFSNPYYQRSSSEQQQPVAPPSTQSGVLSLCPPSDAAKAAAAAAAGIKGLPPPSLLQAAQFAATSGAHTLMSAAGFPYLHAMPSVPVKPAEHKPAAGK